MDMELISKFGAQLLGKVNSWLSPEPPADTPLTQQTAQYLMEHSRFEQLLPYRGFDKDRNLVLLNDGKGIAAGFMLSIRPLLVAGVEAEPQLEAILHACPADSVIQFSVLATSQVGGFLDSWADARTQQTENELLREISVARKLFFEEAANGHFSLLPQETLYPRMLLNFVSVRIPYTGDLASEEDTELWLKNVMDTRDTIQGALSGTGISSTVLDEQQIKVVLREMLCPQLKHRDKVSRRVPGGQFMNDIVDRDSLIVVKGGHLVFSQTTDDQAAAEPSGATAPEGDPDEVWVSALTTDQMPTEVYLPMMAELLGGSRSREERITVPFFAYTTITVLSPDTARERLTAKLGALNKQTMSESPWYRSMMGHLFEQRDAVTGLLKKANSGHPLMRVYSGINLYSDRKGIRRATEYVNGLWRRFGFRASAERFITLPAFVASLPLTYSPEMDPPGRGLQRATTVHSLNAASLAWVQGDWGGHDPSLGGPLLTSRRGQLASINLLESSTNYNFVVVASSGSGKSFFTNEIAVDFLSQNGLVWIIDVGRSYWRVCERLGGQNLVFDPRHPVSLNPFSGLKTQEDLNEMMPVLKAMLRQMAWPLQADEDTPAWEYQAIEMAVDAAWQMKRENTELRDVHQWLLEHGDERAKDLAFQLAPYAIGRHSAWFTGPRKISFDKSLVVVELEELNTDQEMKAVVLTLMIAQITKEIYLSDRAKRKALIIDEAWDLLANVKTGRFIETAFRRVRKYNGIAGVITQSFEDFERSSAAKAAIENAEWKFVLQQSPESVNFAIQNKRLVGDAQLLELLRTVKSGAGFSEIYVRSGGGQGIYRFITDRHSYYLYTTKASEIAEMDRLQQSGMKLSEAIDVMARRDYEQKWGWTMPQILETPEVAQTEAAEEAPY